MSNSRLATISPRYNVRIEEEKEHDRGEKEAMQERMNPGGQRERAISLQLKLASRVKTTFLLLLASIFRPPRRALMKADICIYLIRFHDRHDPALLSA